MKRGIKWTPSGGLPTWYGDVPKAVLYVIARQLGALASGSCDDLAAGDRTILAEWLTQYEAGLVPQRPPK